MNRKENVIFIHRYIRNFLLKMPDMWHSMVYDPPYMVFLTKLEMDL